MDLVHGIDVSAAQAAVDWPALAAQNIEFAMIMAEQGNDGKDSWFARDVAGARAAGIAPGAVLFGYPIGKPGPGRKPEEQVQAFYKASCGLGTMSGEMPPALDLEWPQPAAWPAWGCSDTQICDWALVALQCMQSLWGKVPLLYTYPDFWLRVAGGTHADFAKYLLWEAKYPGKGWPTEAATPFAPWPNFTLWQFDGNGGLVMPDGRDADFDVYFGSDLTQLTGS